MINDVIISIKGGKEALFYGEELWANWQSLEPLVIWI